MFAIHATRGGEGDAVQKSEAMFIGHFVPMRFGAQRESVAFAFEQAPAAGQAGGGDHTGLGDDVEKIGGGVFREAIEFRVAMQAGAELAEFADNLLVALVAGTLENPAFYPETSESPLRIDG